MFASGSEWMTVENLKLVLWIIGWLLTFAVPAASTIYLALKNGNLKEAIGGIVDVIEESKNPSMKDQITFRLPEKIRKGTLNPILDEKGYLEKSKSESEDMNTTQDERSNE